MYACNPSAQEMGQEEQIFEIILIRDQPVVCEMVFQTKPIKNKQKTPNSPLPRKWYGMVVHTYNLIIILSSRDCQPGLHETLFPKRMFEIFLDAIMK